MKNNGLVKSVQFKNHKYIGDPINTVRLFNDLETDELIFLDIEASKKGRCVEVQRVKDIGEEANMPFGVGGGIKTLLQIEQLIHAGAEKVIVCTEAVNRPSFIKEASAEFGSSSIVVCMDIGKTFLGGLKLYSRAGSKSHSIDPLDFAKKMEDFGAGELIIQSVDEDGKMKGYDRQISIDIAKKITIPVTVLGGAGSMEDIFELNQMYPFNGYAAGSIFVYQGNHKGVLINYPSHETKMMCSTQLL